MNGPVVLLIVAAAAIPLTLLFLWVDAALTRRDYQRRIGGDESERYARARARIAHQQNQSNTRIGHRKGHHHDD